MRTRTRPRPAGAAHTEWAWYRRFGGDPAVPPHVKARNRRIVRKAWFRAGASTAVASAGVVLLVFLALFHTLNPIVALIAANGAIAALPAYLASIGSRAIKARHRNTAAAVRAAHADRIHGTPKHDGDPSPRAIGPAVATANLLELLLAIPGTTIFHGLQPAENPDAAADHAVAHGRAVFLLDSVLGRGGTYEWAGGSGEALVRTDRAGAPLPQTLHETASAYRLLLGPEVEVIPIVVVHGASTVRGATSLSANGVHLLTADDAMERIGNTCASGMTEDRGAERVREVLLAGVC